MHGVQARRRSEKAQVYLATGRAHFAAACVDKHPGRLMASDLEGKAVLITGASTGIGAAAARAFARLGSRVAVHYNTSRDAAEKVAADVRALGGEASLVGGDVTDGSVIKRIVAETLTAFGRIDVLINNAGGLVA